MDKKSFKLLIYILLFFWFIFNTFAFDANLKLSDKEVSINEYIKLRVEITSVEWWIEINEIKWLENFDIINQSQSQSSSTNIIVINWKTEREVKTKINLYITLKPKMEWEFLIWPAILTNKNWELKTNFINVKVNWNNLFLNSNKWNALNSPLNQGNIKKEDFKIDTYENIEKKFFNKNTELYVFLWILIIIGILFYFLIKNDYKLSKKVKTKVNFNNKSKSYNKNNKKVNKTEIDFQENKEEINYPDVSNEDFIDEITNILKQKLKIKYNIPSIFNKSFGEIEGYVEDNNIKELLKIVNKAKYSNIIWDKTKILNKVKGL